MSTFLKFFCVCLLATSGFAASAFTELNALEYKNTVHRARTKVKQILSSIDQEKNNETKIIEICEKLRDVPYLAKSTGEGDWKSDSDTYKGKETHVSQLPLYRFDGLDCQTFVQSVLAFLHATDLAEFDKAYIKTSYGAIGNDKGIHFYNRNHFVEINFNSVNEKNHWLSDITTMGELKKYSKLVTTTISPRQWLLHMNQEPRKHVQVLDQKDGDAMLARLQNYTTLPFTALDTKAVEMSYIPKEHIAYYIKNHYVPNYALLNKIKTPAVLEIVNDHRHWQFNGKNIKTLIGTPLIVSHTGILYRKTYRENEFIYHQIRCNYKASVNRKVCEVKPIYCKQKNCNELMLSHATNAHPNNYYWYRAENGDYICSPKINKNTNGKKLVRVSKCNRVEQIPLFDYLTSHQYGFYWIMQNPAILGVHIEKII